MESHALPCSVRIFHDISSNIVQTVDQKIQMKNQEVVQ